MYAEHYSLREEPFNLTPDPRYLFLTPQHAEAFNHLLYGIRQRKGFICLTGEVGAGKTTLCRALLNELGPTVHSALILNPMLSESQLLRAVIEEFGVEAARGDRLDYMTLLNHYLLELTAQSHDAVLIIDEAQDMPDSTLEMTRLLSNLETSTRKLLQIILVGQPELRAKLAKPNLRQLAQRITVRYHLGAMSEQDTRHYVRHRLRIAATADSPPGAVQFDEGALEEIYLFSSGTPRIVNAICDKSLLAGYVQRTGVINRDLVQLAARELKEAG